MNGHGQSDGSVVPAIPPNKAAAAEAGEERGLAKGNTAGETRPGRSAGSGVSSELGRVREVAQRDKDARFTALLHHVSLSRLRWAYWAVNPKAAPGADGVTWAAYGQDLEAKIVQRAVVEVLNAVYEVDFLGFSYGFRPGRGPHQALDALAAGIMRKRVNWVLDADIRDFFGQLDRDWLRKILGHRIADKRVLRLVDRWLAAGPFCPRSGARGTSAASLDQ